MAKNPGLFDRFKGLWARGHADSTPKGYLSDCLNTIYNLGGIARRGGTFSSYGTTFGSLAGYKRLHLYKPNPPFAGLNIPRLIGMKDDGTLRDILLEEDLDTFAAGTDFSLVNFFGRCYITPHDGRVGLQNEVVYVYDGTGASGYHAAGGTAPTVAITAAVSATPGVIEVGTHLFSYCWETDTGFITQPAPFAYVDCFGGFAVDLTAIANGPAGTVAKWIVATQAIPFRANLGDPFDTSTESVQRFPLYFLQRIANNTTTSLTVDFYDENLVEEANFLLTNLDEIPAGVGITEYKGRMVVYGEYNDPSLTRVSEPGEPESFSSTSGFLITDPTDNTGVRAAVEFRDTFYIFKRQRGYLTQDNQEVPSAWQVIPFEKSIGTEQFGLATVIDAKGSSSEGFLLASLVGLYWFNGTFVEPELTYNIIDLWARITQSYFYKVQVINDPIKKRIYCLVPLDGSEDISHIIYGDYRDGLTPVTIKWGLFTFEHTPSCMVAYTDFTNNSPSQVIRMSNVDDIVDLSIDDQELDDFGEGYTDSVSSHFTIPNIRLWEGITDFVAVRIRGFGPVNFAIRCFEIDSESWEDTTLEISAVSPNREFREKINVVSEAMNLKLSCDAEGEHYIINWINVEMVQSWMERPN